MIRFTTNIDCMKSLMPILEKESNEINPQINDTIAVRCDGAEIDMIVVNRRWRGNTLWIELHHPRHFANVIKFEDHVNYIMSM